LFHPASYSFVKLGNLENHERSVLRLHLGKQKNRTLYVGVTTNSIKRVWEHKNKCVLGFASEYGIDRLVYYEQHADIFEAIKREKRLKKWSRKCKLELIRKNKPEWIALYKSICA
jgi:putative endonuclease